MTTAATRRAPPRTAQETMRRYPLLTAHLVCESLGYFTPLAAASAILAHIQGHGNACEWYLHMAAGRRPATAFDPGTPPRPLTEVGRQTLARAFASRHHHKGYMASYQKARLLVEQELAGASPTLFQSW